MVKLSLSLSDITFEELVHGSEEHQDWPLLSHLFLTTAYWKPCQRPTGPHCLGVLPRMLSGVYFSAFLEHILCKKQRVRALIRSSWRVAVLIVFIFPAVNLLLGGRIEQA